MTGMYSGSASLVYVVASVFFWGSLVLGGAVTLHGNLLANPVVVEVDGTRSLGDEGLNEQDVARGVTVVSESVRVSVPVEDPTLRRRALTFIADALPLAVGLGALWLLRGLAGSARRGNPFVQENVKRLRLAGWIALASPLVLDFLSHTLKSYALEGETSWGSVSTYFAWDGVAFTTIAAGLFVFALAEIFAYGLRLREDVESTI